MRKELLQHIVIDKYYTQIAEVKLIIVPGYTNIVCSNKPNFYQVCKKGGYKNSENFDMYLSLFILGKINYEM